MPVPPATYENQVWDSVRVGYLGRRWVIADDERVDHGLRGGALLGTMEVPAPPTSGPVLDPRRHLKGAILFTLLLALACHDARLGDVDCSFTTVDDASWSSGSLADLRAAYASAGSRELDWNVENPVGAASDSVSFEPTAFVSEDAQLCVTGGDSPQLVELSAPVSVAIDGPSWMGTTSAEGLLLVSADGTTGLSVAGPVAMPSTLVESAAALIEAAMGTPVDASEVPAEAWLDVMVREEAGGVDAKLLFAREQTVTFADSAQPEPIGQEVLLARTEH